MDFSHILIVFTWTPLESFMSVHLNRRVSVGAPDFRCKLVCFSQLHLFDFSLAGVHTSVGAPYVLDCQSFQNFPKQSCQSCIKVVITGSDAELFFGDLFSNDFFNALATFLLLGLKGNASLFGQCVSGFMIKHNHIITDPYYVKSSWRKIREWQ